jgi:F0F1-type ATP synthase assembly protein I
MKTAIALLLACLLRPLPARADARGQLDDTRYTHGTYDGTRDDRRGDVYYDGRHHDRRSDWDRTDQTRRRPRREPASPQREPRESGSWSPSFGDTGSVLAGIAGGVVIGFLAFALLGTGPFGLILGAIAAIGGAVAIASFLK